MAVLELEARSGQIRQATSDLQRLEMQGGKTQSAVLSLGRAFAAIGGAAVIGVAIKNTANFSQAIADLSAITGATGRDLEFYRQQAAEIGRTTTLSASQAAEAFKLIASAQPQLLKSAESLARVTKEAVALAEATGSTLPEAAQALGASLNQFGLDSSKASEVINILAASSQLGTAEVASVTEALRNAGSAANSLGIDLAETVAGIQALAASGRQGADAGTALRQVLLRLESTGRSELQPSIVGLNGALNNLAKENLNNIQLMELFGQEAFTAATSLLAQRQVVSELNVTLRGTSTAYEQAATRVDTFNGDLKALNSAIEALQIKVLSDSVDGLGRSFVQAATGGINALSENLETLGDVAVVLTGIFGARMVGALGASTVALGVATGQSILYQASLARMAGLSTSAALSVTALGAAATTASRAMALLGGPIGVIALAAGALIYFAERAETSEDRSRRLSKELNDLATAFDGLTEAQLRNEYNAQAARAFVTLPAEIATAKAQLESYTKVIDEANRKAAQGSGRESQYGAQSEEVRNAQQEIERLNGVITRLEEQALLAERGVSDLGDRLANLPSSAAAAGNSVELAGNKAGLASDKFGSLAESLVAQIIELRDGANAAEEYSLGLQLGADATDVQRTAAESLLSTLQKLRGEREAQQELDRLAADERQTAGQFGGVVQSIAQDLSDDPEVAALEAQLEQRLAIIDEYRMTKQADQMAADEAELAAFEALEKGKTDIAKQEEEARRRTQQQNVAAVGQFFGTMAELARNGGEEQFEAYKAFAIAQALISTYQGATSAYASLATIPYVGPALGAAAAAAAIAMGLQQVAAIKAQKPAGRALGGTVMGSQPYMVGERGPELFVPQANGNITPYNQLMDQAINNQPQKSQNVSINFAITANDSRGFDELLVKRRDLVYNMVQKALNDQGRRF